MAETVIDFGEQDPKVNEKEKKMVKSIFGDIDPNEIGDDPFAVSNGVYFTEVRRAKLQEVKTEKVDEKALTFAFYVDEPDNDEFHNYRIGKYLGFPKDLKSPQNPSGRTYKELNGDEKRQLKFLKSFLRQAFDFSEEDFARPLDPDEFLEKNVYLEIKYNKPYLNIVNYWSPRLWKEEKGDVDESTDDMDIEL